MRNEPGAVLVFEAGNKRQKEKNEGTSSLELAMGPYD